MSEARRTWLKGFASGVLACLILLFWSPEFLFGERAEYTASYMRLHDDPPRVSTPILDASDAAIEQDDLLTGDTPPAISLLKIEKLFALTPAMVESVCISMARLDHDNMERWAANIRLKDPSVLIAATAAAGAFGDLERRPLGLIQYAGPHGFSAQLQAGRFTSKAVLDAEDNRSSPFDFKLHFNELHVPEASQVLLELSPDYRVPPCSGLTDLTIYNRWRDQWTDGRPGVVRLSDEWHEKFSSLR